MSEKLQEAAVHVKAAEKFQKTGILRWKPDYDSAADEFNQAAQCYRIGRDSKMAKECLIKASEMYNKNHSFFHAGKTLENAILVGKTISTSDELFSLACEAASLYQQHGSGDSGANVLDKTAKIIEENSPELAVKLYQQAADVSTVESSQHQGMEYISKASRLLVKLGRYNEAVENLRREMELNREANNTGAVGRLTVAIVLVQLARGDVIAAEKVYTEWGAYCEAQEQMTLESILQAYDEEDRQGAKRALNSPFIKSMDVEYARLINTIPLPEATEPVVGAGVRANAAPSYVSPSSGGQTQAGGSSLQSAGQGAAGGHIQEEDESPYETVSIKSQKGSDGEEEGGDLC